MASFYEDASLVVIPSGYKTSKIYAEKPTDGSGDLTFTRASGATRVGANGLIEEVRTNLCLQSNTFSNAAWNKIAQGTGTTPVVTANYTTDPFGGNNGWRLQCNLGGGTTTSDRSWLQQDIAGTTVPTTVSVYAKLNSAGSATFALTNASTDNVTITSTDWVRISTVRTIATTVYSFRIGLIGGVGQSGTLDISIAFAQLETGDIATNYIPTTTAAVSVGPVSNVPRLDYTNSSCPRLLLEGQRTNLVVQSNFLNLWSRFQNTTKSFDSAVLDPAGNPSSRYLRNSSSTALASRDGVSILANTTYTFTYYARKGNYSAQLVEVGFGTNNVRVTYNFDTNTFSSSTAGTQTLLSTSAQAVGNGWVRIALTFTGSITTVNCAFLIGDAVNNFVYLYGTQLEAGSYATSYIPTLAASVTRVADALSLLTLPNSNMTFTAVLTMASNPIGGTADDWLRISAASILGRAYGYSASFGFADDYGVGTTAGRKIAWKQESGTTAKIFSNGSLVGTSTTGTYSSPFVQFVINGGLLAAPLRIESFLFFDAALPDAEIIELTTL